MSPHPLVDPVAWARLLLGVVLTLGLPGWWILGRFAGGTWPLRLVLSLATGFLAATPAAPTAGSAPGTGLLFAAAFTVRFAGSLAVIVSAPGLISG